MKKVIVLAATINQLPVISLLKELGYYVISIDNVPENIGHPVADKNYFIDITDIPAIENVAKQEGIIAIIAAYTDVGVCPAAHVSQEMGLIGCNYHAAETLTSKSKFRAFYKKEIEPEFTFETFTQLDFEDWLQQQPNAKWIVKPVDSSGSKGIEIITKNDHSAIGRAFEYSKRKKVIVEQFYEGEQGTLEGFMRGGKLFFHIITSRLTAPEPNVATQGHVYPSVFSEEQQKEIMDKVLLVCAKLDLYEGPLDVDFVYNESGVHLIEMSPRLGGNNLSNFLEAVTHVNLRKMTVDYYLNAPPQDYQPTIDSNFKYVQWVMTSSRDGILTYNRKKAVNAELLHYVEELNLFEPSGTAVRKFTNGRDSYGFLILRIPRKAKIATYLNKLEAFLELKIEPAA